MKTILVKNKYGQIKHVPENLITDLLKHPGFEIVGEDKKKEEGGDFVCPECGFVAKSQFGLMAHLRKHKK